MQAALESLEKVWAEHTIVLPSFTRLPENEDGTSNGTLTGQRSNTRAWRVFRIFPFTLRWCWSLHVRFKRGYDHRHKPASHRGTPGLNSSLHCVSFPSLYPSYNFNLSTLRRRYSAIPNTWVIYSPNFGRWYGLPLVSKLGIVLTLNNNNNNNKGTQAHSTSHPSPALRNAYVRGITCNWN